jgi:hypothetical protein
MININIVQSFDLQKKYLSEFNEIFFETNKFLLNDSLLNNDFKISLIYTNLLIKPFESNLLFLS